jgi:hypothetical protein
MEIPWWKFEFPGNKFLPWILRPLRTEVRAVLWTYRTVQCWAGNLTLWNAARFFRCQKPDLKPQSIDGSESFPSNRGSSYCFHGGTLKIIQSSWMTMTMTLYWNLWWRLGIPRDLRKTMKAMSLSPRFYCPPGVPTTQGRSRRHGLGMGFIQAPKTHKNWNSQKILQKRMWRIPVHNFLISTLW